MLFTGGSFYRSLWQCLFSRETKLQVLVFTIWVWDYPMTRRHIPKQVYSRKKCRLDQPLAIRWFNELNSQTQPILSTFSIHPHIKVCRWFMRCYGPRPDSCKMFRLFIETRREKVQRWPLPHLHAKLYLESSTWCLHWTSSTHFHLQSWRQEETKAEGCRVWIQQQTFTWDFFQHPALAYSFNLFTITLINSSF